MSGIYPLVSVVIPAYNAAPYIQQAIDSVLKQTYPNIEILVVDDGSKDDTLELLWECYGDHTRVRIIAQGNAGASAARNRGIAEAHGDFVHFLDADEFLLPEKISESYALFTANPEIGVVYGHGIPVEADGVTVIPLEYKPLPSGDVFCEWINGTMSGGTYGVTSSFMVRRSALNDVGGFDVDLPVCHDWDLWLRLSAKYPFAALEGKWVYYRRLESGLHAARLKMALDRLAVTQRLAGYGYERCLSHAEYQRLLAGRWQTVALRHWEQGNRAPARAAFREAIHISPTNHTIRRAYILMSYALPVRSADLLATLTTRVKRLLGRA